MVPARLTVRNFLCYGTDCPPLELEGIGLACLTGDNGHGKSALMDAITWALWGKARGKTADALIHHGQRDMEVDFEFLVGDAKYRVVRRRTRASGRSPGRSDLQFQIWAGSEWKPLTGNSQHDTERAIADTVKLSYETFANSALLLQGKADLFTAAGPAERKRVLAEILSLEQYDRLEAAAKELRRARAHDAELLANALADIETEIADLPDKEAELQRVRAELEETGERRRELDREHQGLRAAMEVLERQKAELDDAERARQRDAEAVATIGRQLAELAATIENDERIAATAPAVRDGYDRLLAARESERRWSAALLRRQQIDQRLAPLYEAIDRARQALEADLRDARLELKRTSEVAARQAELERELATLDARIAALAEREAQLASLAHGAQRSRDEIARLEEENKQLRRSVDEKKARLDDLRAAEARGESSCPLCRTPLGPDGLHQIEAVWQAEGKAIADHIRANRARIAALQGDLTRTERAAEGVRTQLESERRGLDRRIGAVRGQLDQAREAAARLVDVRTAVAALESRLAADDFAQEPRRQAAALAAERDAIAYDPEAHRAARERAIELEHYDARYRDLSVTLERLELNRKAHEQQQAALVEARLRLQQTEERVAALTAAVAAYPDISRSLRELEERVQALASTEAALRQTLGGLETTVARCRELARQHAEKVAQCAQLRREEAIYDELARAFGKNGVQALIIDAVLPEIEREANHLLAGMTNGRMAVTLDTQRTLRNGELAETLEIRIADEWGTRDYEMYSGGEGFRVNLALRIALAKLLARRSGAPLPTLIIDEGFGSQDAAGQERMVEAITAIQHDFACLLVVTHIEELKQLFDRRIEVVKRPSGSIARVVVT